jgi:hypothetical protein
VREAAGAGGCPGAARMWEGRSTHSCAATLLLLQSAQRQNERGQVTRPAASLPTNVSQTAAPNGGGLRAASSSGPCQPAPHLQQAVVIVEGGQLGRRRRSGAASLQEPPDAWVSQRV